MLVIAACSDGIMARLIEIEPVSLEAVVYQDYRNTLTTALEKANEYPFWH